MGELIVSNEPSVLFIGGTGRCGSSILREAIGNHSDCGVLPFEHRFLIDPDGIVDFYSSFENAWSPYNQDLRLKRLFIFLKTLAGGRLGSPQVSDWLLSDEQYNGWNLQDRISGMDRLIDNLLSDLTDFKFDAKWVGGREFDGEQTIWFSQFKTKKDILEVIQKFCWAAFNRLLGGMNKSIYVEDNTWNMLYALQLHDIFPHAKFVHIYRNPLDVVASFIEQSWCPRDVMQAAEFYISLMDRWHIIEGQLPEDSYINMSFENLVEDPKRVYQQVCELLEITFEESMLDTEIHSSPVGKWKSTIPNEFHESLKYRLTDYINKYG